MVPTLVPEPFHRDGWIYEEKVDGWREPTLAKPTRRSPCS